MKVCIYLRKSRADREHPEMPPEAVLRNHEGQLLAYAAKAGFDVLGIKKEVVSGESLIRRPEMLSLLEEVEDRRYDAVLVKDFDRLGRGSMLEQGIIIEAFRKSGTKIITPEKVYDLENEFDEEFIDISALFARKELKMITKRLQSGRMRSVSDGNYISPHPPFGYERSQKSLIINEKESEIVRLIFMMYVKYGYGDAKIASYLNSRGIPGKHGLARWDKTTIRGILRNPVYAGMITWNRRDYRYRDDGRRTSRFRNRSDWNIYPGKHEAIIDQELFDQARSESESRSAPHLGQKKQLRNPLAQLVRCGSCGAAMTLRTSKGREDSLRCSKQCGKTAGSSIRLVEEKLLILLEDLLAKADLNLSLCFPDAPSRSSAKSAQSDTDTLLHQTRKCFQSEKNRLLLQQKRLYELLEQGIYDSDTFCARTAAIEDRLEFLEEKLQESWRDPADVGNTAEIESQSETKCSSGNKPNGAISRGSVNVHEFLRSEYIRLDTEHKNAFLRKVVGCIIYHKAPGGAKDEFTLEVVLKH